MTKEELKALRTCLGLTQQQFAESIGTTKHRVSDWENGKHQASKSYATLIEAKYSKELDSIRVKELNNLLLVKPKQQSK